MKVAEFSPVGTSPNVMWSNRSERARLFAGENSLPTTSRVQTAERLPELATRYLTKERAHADFAPPEQFFDAPCAGDAFRRKRTNGAAGRFPSRPLTAQNSRLQTCVMMGEWRESRLPWLLSSPLRNSNHPGSYDMLTAPWRAKSSDICATNARGFSLEVQTPITVLFHSFTFPAAADLGRVRIARYHLRLPCYSSFPFKKSISGQTTVSKKLLPL